MLCSVQRERLCASLGQCIEASRQRAQSFESGAARRDEQQKKKSSGAHEQRHRSASTSKLLPGALREGGSGGSLGQRPISRDPACAVTRRAKKKKKGHRALISCRLARQVHRSCSLALCAKVKVVEIRVKGRSAENERAA